jgi:hypothetical protein
MKKIFKSVLTLALVAGLGFAANAQTTSVINRDVTASAEILSALSLTKNTDINFGSLSASTPGVVFLDPTGVANTNTGVTTSVGKFTLLGGLGADVKVSWPATIILQGDQAPADQITYQILVHGSNTDLASGSSSLGAQGVGTTADIILEAVTGNYFLYVGGGFPALIAQPTGTYTGTANFTVEYN